MKEWVDVHDPGSAIIPFSGSLEARLIDMNDDGRVAYLKEHQTSRSLTFVSLVMCCWPSVVSSHLQPGCCCSVVSTAPIVC